MVAVSFGRMYLRVRGDGWSVSSPWDRPDGLLTARVVYNALVARDLWGALSRAQQSRIEAEF